MWAKSDEKLEEKGKEEVLATNENEEHAALSSKKGVIFSVVYNTNSGKTEDGQSKTEDAL